MLYMSGWLDLSKGPLALHVPGMAGRYYRMQFTDPSIGTRTTGAASSPGNTQVS